MGLYVDPINESKEEFLNREGELSAQGYGESHIDFDLIPEDTFVVCLVDNLHFTAGAVAFSEREFRVFNEPDGRYKKWYVVPKDKLSDNCPEWEYYKEVL